MKLAETRKALREQRKITKNKIKQAKKENAATILFRIDQAVDSIALKLCQPFVNRYDDITYKREQPEHYHADKVLEAAAVLEAQLRKKETLSQKDQKMCLFYIPQLIKIKEEELGATPEEAEKLADSLIRIGESKYQPSKEEKVMMAEIDKMVSIMEAFQKDPQKIQEILEAK